MEVLQTSALPLGYRADIPEDNDDFIIVKALDARFGKRPRFCMSYRTRRPHKSATIWAKLL